MCGVAAAVHVSIALFNRLVLPSGRATTGGLWLLRCRTYGVSYFYDNEAVATLEVISPEELEHVAL